MSPEWTRLAPHAEELIKRWRMLPDGIVVGDGPEGHLEHLIHEVAHMVSLGWHRYDSKTLMFDPKMPDIISVELGLHADHGVEEETWVWAIEWYVWQEIGLDEHFGWDTLLDAALIQECNLDDIEALVKAEHPDHEKIKEMAGMVLAEVKRLLLRPRG